MFCKRTSSHEALVKRDMGLTLLNTIVINALVKFCTYVYEFCRVKLNYIWVECLIGDFMRFQI